MTYKLVKPARVGDVDYILAHLWKRGEQELEGLGLDERHARSMFREYIKKGRSGTLLWKDAPVCVSGSYLEFDCGGWVTWMVATDDFAEHALEVTRILRDEIEDLPGQVFVYSQTIHPETAKWFRVLGLERDEWEGKTPTGKPLYCFRKA